MIFFQRFDLDQEKDIVVELFLEGERLFYVIRTPNHHSGNLITNLARLCGLSTERDRNGLLVIRGEVPSYVDGSNRMMYILRLGNTKVANIFPDGTVELKASIPAISKTLMSQTKDYRLGIEKTIVKTYIRGDCKFRTDLHTHMNGNLPPDVLIALGIMRQLRYPYYYIRKLGLSCTEEQRRLLAERRIRAEEALRDLPLTGKHRERRIDDYTFINFADLILGNLPDAEQNIERIRNSLTIPKDGQAVFTDLEKVYLYRYVFTRGQPAEDPFSGLNTEGIPDREVRACAEQIRRDLEDPRFSGSTLFQHLLLWIAREYRRHGITYAEISDTALLKPEEFPDRLRQIHECMPLITRETGVTLRFLASIRRIPLTIVRDQVTPDGYLADNLRCLRIVAEDPYVAGSDIVGEEINDILELRPLIRELVQIAGGHPGFVLRVHAGENDSLRDNVANTLRCVRESLAPDQSFPALRIGHGLYTCNLRSARGQKLLEEMARYRAVLEFQITSNVRLNNLSTLTRHPLKEYLRAGVRCVQGTDGGALYGTNSIDEELSLEKLLGLTHEDLLQMKRTEEEILKESLRVFGEKLARFREKCPSGDIGRFYRTQLEDREAPTARLREGSSGTVSAEKALAGLMTHLPEALFPVTVAGGSFHSSGRRPVLHPEDEKLIDDLLAAADPERVCFVIGHTLTAQENYLARRAAGRFRIFAIVPREITPAQAARLSALRPGVLLSVDSSGMGLYKSFAYEIFRKTPSVLLAFDGNSAAQNLIQEARNARNKCQIFFNPRSRALSSKARILEGYVQPLTDAAAVLEALPGR